MLIFLLISAQLLTALIDAVRIRYAPEGTQNISKKITVLIAVLVAACIYTIMRWYFNTTPAWHSAFVFIAWRWLLYDGFLNLLRREKIDYESRHTNSVIDLKEQHYKISFWQQRAYAAMVLLAYYLIQLL